MKNCYLGLIAVLFYLLAMSAYGSKLALHSPAFSNNMVIPQQYTCQGADVSPPLFWEGLPRGTKSFVLILDDPNATSGDWVHWVLFNIPATTKVLSEATGLSAGTVSGRNSWGKNGYRGPCPPSGTHHYFFRLYALNTRLNLNSKASREEVVKAMAGHVLGTSELMGVYSKD